MACPLTVSDRILEVVRFITREGVGSLSTKEGTVKKDNTKSPTGRNDQKSDTIRKQTARAPQPASVRLTCNEAQLDALMSEGEST
jgi:hypothetical protein